MIELENGINLPPCGPKSLPQRADARFLETMWEKTRKLKVFGIKGVENVTLNQFIGFFYVEAGPFMNHSQVFFLHATVYDPTRAQLGPRVLSVSFPINPMRRSRGGHQRHRSVCLHTVQSPLASFTLQRRAGEEGRRGKWKKRLGGGGKIWNDCIQWQWADDFPKETIKRGRRYRVFQKNWVQRSLLGTRSTEIHYRF